MDDTSIIKTLRSCGSGKSACDECHFNKLDNKLERERYFPECLFNAVHTAAYRLAKLGVENRRLKDDLFAARSEAAGAGAQAERGWRSFDDVVAQRDEARAEANKLRIENDAGKRLFAALERVLYGDESWKRNARQNVYGVACAMAEYRAEIGMPPRWECGTSDPCAEAPAISPSRPPDNYIGESAVEYGAPFDEPIPEVTQ